MEQFEDWLNLKEPASQFYKILHHIFPKKFKNIFYFIFFL